MEDSSQKNTNSTFQNVRALSLSKKLLENKMRKNFNEKILLKNISKNLTMEIWKKKRLEQKEACPVEDSGEGRVDHQVKLRCRQLPSVVKELRKALMKQNWDDVTTLTTILCRPGLKYYSTIILKVCLILLFSHPDSNLGLLQKFIRITTEYVLKEDINKFIKILFTLRQSELSPLESGKYIRKTGDYKVTKDPEFVKI